MRHGVTLLELLVVLSLAGLLTALAAPSLIAAADRGAVRMGLAQLRGAHDEARMAAVTGDGIAILTVASDSVALRIVQHGDTLLRWQRVGPRSLGVTLAGPARTFRFAPSGLPIGAANATLTLTRNGVTGRLVVSRLGRMRTEML